MLLGFLLLDVGADVDRITQLNVTVEPSYLQLAHFILGLAHQVSDALGCLNVGRTVRDDHILCRHEHRHLATQTRIVVNLLERCTCQAKVKQHALVLGAVLDHLLGHLIVHVHTDTFSSFFFELVNRTHDLCLHRASGGESLHD